MKNVEWKYLKGLHQLYTERKTKLKILNNNYINQILFTQKKLIIKTVTTLLLRQIIDTYNSMSKNF